MTVRFRSTLPSPSGERGSSAAWETQLVRGGRIRQHDRSAAFCSGTQTATVIKSSTRTAMNTSTKTEMLAATTVSDPRRAAVRARDPLADGKFFYLVKTTGLCCRPTCAARRARPEDVGFYPTRAAPGRAGLRPCKRCYEKSVRAVAQACAGNAPAVAIP